MDCVSFPRPSSVPRSGSMVSSQVSGRQCAAGCPKDTHDNVSDTTSLVSPSSPSRSLEHVTSGRLQANSSLRIQAGVVCVVVGIVLCWFVCCCCW